MFKNRAGDNLVSALPFSRSAIKPRVEVVLKNIGRNIVSGSDKLQQSWRVSTGRRCWLGNLCRIVYLGTFFQLRVSSRGAFHLAHHTPREFCNSTRQTVELPRGLAALGVLLHCCSRDHPERSKLVEETSQL